MKKNLLHLLENDPVIPAVKDEAGLQAVLNTDCEIVFIL